MKDSNEDQPLDNDPSFFIHQRKYSLNKDKSHDYNSFQNSPRGFYKCDDGTSTQLPEILENEIFSTYSNQQRMKSIDGLDQKTSFS